ncbi:MAG TPA: hypothetical protein VE078_13730 [Thermoanaerobaculia bacterium]|nr:hypothetical protein [Thermoanaerobaculia bacterium]
MSKKGEPLLSSVALLKGWEGEEGQANEMLRETALSLISRPAAESLQSASAWFMFLHLDRSQPWPRYRGSIPRARLRGAMLDLRHTARFLADLTLVLNDTELDYADPKLSLFTNGLAIRIERIANEIEARISPGASRKPKA